MYRIGVVSLFPELVEPVVRSGVVGRARERGLLALEHASPRDFVHDKHRTVDDRPYGGGPGMVLKFEPLRDAVRALRARLPVILYSGNLGEIEAQQARLGLCRVLRKPVEPGELREALGHCLGDGRGAP